MAAAPRPRPAPSTYRIASAAMGAGNGARSRLRDYRMVGTPFIDSHRSHPSHPPLPSFASPPEGRRIHTGCWAASRPAPRLGDHAFSGTRPPALGCPIAGAVTGGEMPAPRRHPGNTGSARSRAAHYATEDMRRPIGLMEIGLSLRRHLGRRTMRLRGMPPSTTIPHPAGRPRLLAAIFRRKDTANSNIVRGVAPADLRQAV